MLAAVAESVKLQNAATLTGRLLLSWASWNCSDGVLGDEERLLLDSKAVIAAVWNCTMPGSDPESGNV